MKFTIGIPVFMQQEYLPDTIDSVLDQTFTDYEIIICNDGSPDHSREIAEKYSLEHGTKKIKVINQVNKGLASARNTLIMNMKGEYFLPLDSDDCLLENCLEEMAKAIDNSHADIIVPSFKHFGILNTPLMVHPEPTIELFKTVGNLFPYFSAIKREALLECGGYSPRMTWGFEDFHLWFDLFSRGKSVHVIQQILVLYRTKENSMLTEANKHSVELLTQIAKDFPQYFS